MPKHSKPKNRRSRRNFALFFTSLLLTMLVCGWAAAMILVDKNSRRVGWDESRTVFAVAGQQDKLRFTLMGSRLSLRIRLPAQVNAVLRGVERGYRVIEPPGERLWEELHTVAQHMVGQQFREMTSSKKG